MNQFLLATTYALVQVHPNITRHFTQYGTDVFRRLRERERNRDAEKGGSVYVATIPFRIVLDAAAETEEMETNEARIWMQ